MLENLLLQTFAILVMLGILSVLIIVHEIGHFSVARFFGFQTPVFGFGLPFGPHWVVGRRWGTEFRIHACLLGGYVAIPELGDESNTEDAFGVPLKPFRKFPIWQRALVAAAGVAMNILFAYLVMVVMFLSLGEPSQPTVVHSLIKQNPIAANAGIKVGDRVLAIDDAKVHGPDDAVHYLIGHKSAQVKIKVLRDGNQLDIPVTTNQDGKVGMALVSKGEMKYEPVEGNFFQIAGVAWVKLWSLTWNMLEALGQMLAGLFATQTDSSGHPSLGIQDLHGVLAVVKIGADIAQQDWSQLFLFTIMISMDLAIINLLPWPALDGGHLAFMGIEAVRGRPLGERAQGEIVKWGFISLILLMAVVMVKDVASLFSGKLDFKVKKEEQKQESQEKKKAAPQEQSGDSTSVPEQAVEQPVVDGDTPVEKTVEPGGNSGNDEDQSAQTTSGPGSGPPGAEPAQQPAVPSPAAP